MFKGVDARAQGQAQATKDACLGWQLRNPALMPSNYVAPALMTLARIKKKELGGFAGRKCQVSVYQMESQRIVPSILHNTRTQHETTPRRSHKKSKTSCDNGRQQTSS